MVQSNHPVLPSLANPDKTGAKIYAGDIILISEIMANNHVCNMLVVLLWEEHAFMVKLIDPKGNERDANHCLEILLHPLQDNMYLEVVSNIHQDPDILS